jgi:lysozyme
MVKLKGLDVSHWQGNVNWSKVKANADFVFVKCSEGSSYVDPNFVSNVKEAAAAGLKVGAYHYATFNDVASAKEQANYFLSKVKGLTLTYPLVLDLEEDKKKAGKQQLTMRQLLSWKCWKVPDISPSSIPILISSTMN